MPYILIVVHSAAPADIRIQGLTGSIGATTGAPLDGLRQVILPVTRDVHNYLQSDSRHWRRAGEEPGDRDQRVKAATGPEMRR